MSRQLDSGAPDTVVLIHGLFLTAKSWEHWVERYEGRGYRVIARDWPGMEGEIEELRRDLPNVRDRYDEQAQAMQETAVPQDILNALETADGTTPERTAQSDTRADGSSPHE